MNYTLNSFQNQTQPATQSWKSITKLWPFIQEEKRWLFVSLLAILINSGLTIWAPIIVGNAVDKAILPHDWPGVVRACVELLAIFIATVISGFIQTRVMGGVGQRILFRLRNAIFAKLEEMPVAFFNQNKAGDLISRINNDTDKLNQFFSQALMQFIGNIFVIVGAGIAMLWVNLRLGSASLAPAILLLVLVLVTSAWVKRTSFGSMQAMGGLSAEIQESLDNFKAIIAFNRRDYFRQRFQQVNEANYSQAVKAGIAGITYVPAFGWATNLGQLIVIIYGLHLISVGDFSFGLLVSYLAYVARFYSPLQQLASIWSNFQMALAGWDRISEILALKSNLDIIPYQTVNHSATVIELQNISFGYTADHQVLHQINLKMEQGKTYALVGPTGGGKTTTASLIARLFDPTEGQVLLHNQDIRAYTDAERTQKIGFILQDPFLFGGTVRDNILYGNQEHSNYSAQQLTEVMANLGLTEILERFDQGLDTPVTSGESMSLGQKQLIAFVRAVLRHPDLLILDEATANIDTVTEQLLDKILKGLPSHTTRVVIAHRLNTIQNADEIFFVNAGTITAAGSFNHAVELLQQGHRDS
jgi:ATP-binding cassette subfamily B protein